MLISKQFQKNVLGHADFSCGTLFLLANSLACFFDSSVEPSSKDNLDTASNFLNEKQIALAEASNNSNGCAIAIDALDPENGKIGFFVIKQSMDEIKHLREMRSEKRVSSVNLVKKLICLKKCILSIERASTLFLC